MSAASDAAARIPPRVRSPLLSNSCAISRIVSPSRNVIGTQVDVAARDLCDDLLDRHRPIEPILPGLQPAACARIRASSKR